MPLANSQAPATARPRTTATDTVSPRAAIIALLIRIHFYIGLFVGPFIFIAALTGTLYALTPQIENRLYAHQLFSESEGAPHSLAEQIVAAQAVPGHPAATPSAIRPSPAPGETTRIMFSSPELGPSESRAIFVDPVSLEIRGDETVYGTSGILPFRTWLDYLHRGLLLGDIGRNYSELAASWLWLAALGGLTIWWTTRHATSPSRRRNVTGVQTPAAKKRRLRHWHTTMGLGLLIGIFFFSATGLTWSQWAGNNIAVARSTLGWQTPSVKTQLAEDTAHHAHAPLADAHAKHRMPMNDTVVDTQPAMFDQVLAVARDAGINADKIEIKPARKPRHAWTVSEIDRSWPTQVDAVSINPDTLAVLDRIDFTTFPLAAKLTRWGVDAHMGVLFGLANQLLLAAFGLGLCIMIVWGYRMWWIRRPSHRDGSNPVKTLTEAVLQIRIFPRLLAIAFTILLALCLPVMGFSLLIFIFIDVIRWYRSNARQIIAKV
ncbi:hypothetical protein DDT52_02810 [Brenneria roseae subsp. roseae]|uniref:PepSY-associated TM helix domain-containing protein n=1 Tax=Brenneria roseae TaxID=1509241 RepID=UPI000D6202E7|nr:PepSY-associated TM helix domain-containing protein [Brenneria roseae]PWC22203.1 hypothetical protein DDT52_02810 [Brenneria roseae subsp. roseae]